MVYTQQSLETAEDTGATFSNHSSSDNVSEDLNATYLMFSFPTTVNSSRGGDACLGSACLWCWFVVEGRPTRASHSVHSVSVNTNHLR
jgi:hypothetical protein